MLLRLRLRLLQPHIILLLHLLLHHLLLIGLEGRLLAERWLRYLGWLRMELLVLRLHLLHLHLLLLYGILLLGVRLWGELIHLSCLNRLLSHRLRRLLDLFYHRGVGHATGGWSGILVLGPLLNLIISARDKLVTEVE